MSTKSKIRTTIELNSGDKERLQNIALELGIIQTTGNEAGKVGSVSKLMQSIAEGQVKVTKNVESKS